MQVFNFIKIYKWSRRQYASN